MTNSTPLEAFRRATRFEDAVIRKILAADASLTRFSEQLREIEVARIDEYGSLCIRAAGARLEDFTGPMRKLPAEAQSADSDGVDVHFLLFHQNGWLCELQIYKDDGTPIEAMPSSDDLAVFVLK